MKATLNYGSMRNQCPACCALFSTVRNFDAHRTGRFGVDRRCMTADEMQARGLRLDARGDWRQEGPSQQERDRLFAARASEVGSDVIHEEARPA